MRAGPAEVAPAEEPGDRARPRSYQPGSSTMKVTPSAFLALAGAVPAQYQFVVRDAEPVFGLDPAAISAGGLAAGDVDLPAAASLSGTSVFVNHHRQLASPGEPVPGGALTRAVRDEFR